MSHSSWFRRMSLLGSGSDDMGARNVSVNFLFGYGIENMGGQVDDAV